jgi:hypothetical protein
MPSKNTNGLLWTLAIIGGVAILFFKVILPKLKATGSGGSGAATSANAGGDPDDPYANNGDYYGNGNNPGSGLGNLLNSLASLLGSSGKSSGGGGGSLPGAVGPGIGGNGMATDSGDGPNADFFNSLLEGLYTDPNGNVLIQGSESNPDLGGDSLFTFDDDNSNVNPLTDGSGGSIDSVPVDGGTFSSWFSGFSQPLPDSPDGSIVNSSQASSQSNNADANPGMTLPGGTDNLDGNAGGDNGSQSFGGGATGPDDNDGSTGDAGNYGGDSYAGYGGDASYGDDSGDDD